jgi:hypothetical protein
MVVAPAPDPLCCKPVRSADLSAQASTRKANAMGDMLNSLRFMIIPLESRDRL